MFLFLGVFVWVSQQQKKCSLNLNVKTHISLICLCLQEVLNMLKESKADIFVDPVLHTACALDLKHHCAAITPGRGRRGCFHTIFLLVQNCQAG